ncbi:hypothetical protein D9757_010062 [Collybiopsis confluens]|uniref:Uncharacterized protein n=1 Tax=Collybiopsis confluens TaxID=2823264 RepID=A0A8H5LYG5_9AGAR|nr:hypothetical protein D9757_014356 [Collybiopsis confluens]KAF5374019.1 hypothetical protein D9757_010062 [Collybiopsis confluens]
MSNATESAFSPVIPFQLLPPSIAFQLQIKTYIFAGASGVFVWDVLTNIVSDWHLFLLAKNKYSLAAYAMSRIGALGYVIGRTAYMTYPMGNCRLADILVDCCFPIGMAGSSLLFFLRARAVYMGHKYITALFAFLWLSTLAACLTIPFATYPDTTNIENTAYCVTVATKDFAVAAVVVPTVTDIIVFLAISYRLMSHGFTESRGIGNRILGRNLPAFSRALLRDGQKYFLVTVVSNLATIALGCAQISPIYQWMFTGPNLMMTNIMACYVFRHTILSQRGPHAITDVHVIPTTIERNQDSNIPGHGTHSRSPTQISAVRGIIVEMTSVMHIDKIEDTKAVEYIV